MSYPARVEGLVNIYNDNSQGQKKQTCHRGKIKESKKLYKYLNLERAEKVVKHEDDGDTNDIWSPWNGPQRSEKRNWGNLRSVEESKPSWPQPFSSRIFRRVLEISRDLLSLRLQWKPPVTICVKIWHRVKIIIIKGLNTRAVSLVRYSGSFLKWTREELRQMDHRTRKLMTIHKALHPRDEMDRPNVMWKEGWSRL